MRTWLVIIVVALLAGLCFAGSVFVRYPVGQPVPAEVYTAPFDPCDPAYKFMVPPPKDWAEKFGNNERTMLIHAVSELRVVVAAQSKRLLALEEWQKKQPVWDPNDNGTDVNAVPNEAKP